MALARAHGWARGWPLAEEALTLIEQLTRRQRSLFDQQRYLVEKLQVYEYALGLALDAIAASPSPAAREWAILRAWQVAERAKSFSLRQAMTQGGWLEAIDPDCAAELATLDQRLEAIEAQAERSEAAAQRQAELIAQHQQVLQTAMHRSPMLKQTAAAPELDLASVLHQLPAGVGVVSWYWLARSESCSLHIFHAGADRRPHHIQSEFTSDEVSALNQAKRECVGPIRPFRIQQILPAALGDKVFPPALLEQVDTCHTLLLTPHRYLRQVPLHAAELTARESTETKTERLIERFAVQVLPTLALPFPPHTSRKKKSNVFLMGCHVDGFHHEALDDVPLELQNLAAIWRSAGHDVHDYALPPSGRLAQHVTLPQWSDFDVIHLACHGSFMPGSPLDATLYLGSEALRASEFFGLRLRSDVVCLSACDVGQQGDTLDGLTLVSDEWLGLALPLFQAGARSLLVSLWRADSKRARIFMQHFHEALAQGLDPARAHQKACLAEIGERRPYGFWANWQLAGFPA
jgi:CHAT domain-containing protein